MPTHHQFMEALERLESVEAAIYGNPAEQRKGLFERVNSIETQVNEIRSAAQKIIWLLVLGILGALLNLVIGTRTASNISHSLQQISPAAERPVEKQ